jgi:hypothetical protein
MGGAGGMGMGGAGGMGMGGAGGGLPDCNDALANDFNLLEACEMCLAGSCCTEVSECAAADNCPVCITGAEQCSVDAEGPAMTIVGCAQAQCQAECFDPPPACVLARLPGADGFAVWGLLRPGRGRVRV